MDDPLPHPVAVLARAADQARAALTVIEPGHLDLPTPCPGWSVRDLAAHLTAAPGHFVQMMRGEEVDWSPSPDVADGDWPTRFRSDAQELLSHWREQPDDQVTMADWQSAELAVHTWDLLRATGRSMPLDPEVAERALAFMRQGLTPQNRGDAFAAEVEVPPGSGPYERLAGFAGRDPSS